MSELVREMTLQEEICALPIEDNVKERLLSKLKRYDYLEEEHKCLLAKQREEMFATIIPLKEANAALLTACEGLSKAMVAQRRCFNDIER